MKERARGREKEKERREERSGGGREERKKEKLFRVLEVAVHRGFSCSFCILSCWHTQSCDNTLTPSHDVPTSPGGFNTCLSHANLKVGQTATQFRAHFVELRSSR